MQPVNQSSPQQVDECQSIEILTQQALAASQAGDWDRVADCYVRRGISLQIRMPDQALAQRMLVLDEQIRAAVRVAQVAIAGLLADTAQVTWQLRRLRESAGPMSTEQGTMHREA